MFKMYHIMCLFTRRIEQNHRVDLNLLIFSEQLMSERAAKRRRAIGGMVANYGTAR